MKSQQYAAYRNETVMLSKLKKKLLYKTTKVMSQFFHGEKRYGTLRYVTAKFTELSIFYQNDRFP